MLGAKEIARSCVDRDVEEGTYAAGDPEAFERLYRTTHARLLRTLYGLVGPDAAEDCAQVAFEKAYRAWPRWRGDAPAEAWLYRIAINVAVSHRRRSRLVEIVSMLASGPGAASDAPVESRGQEVTEAVRRLPTKLAAAVMLRYYHGYSNREIARILGVAERTVGWRLREAVARLRKELDAGLADFGEPERLSLRNGQHEAI